MIELTWALAGQIVVITILAVVAAVAIAAGVAWVIFWLFGDRLALAFGGAACEDLDEDNDDAHDDPEHMRVVREHGAGTALDHRSIPLPYRGSAT